MTKLAFQFYNKSCTFLIRLFDKKIPRTHHFLNQQRRKMSSQENTKKRDESVLILGGGPAGLGAALAFHNANYTNIVVLEGRPDMNFDLENSYAIGINLRGQNAIKTLMADPEQGKVNVLYFGNFPVLF